MGQFFIEYDGGEDTGVEYYELSITTDVNLSYIGNPTQHPVEDGTTITDQIQNQNVRGSFQGLVTNIKNVRLGPIIVSPTQQTQNLILQNQRSVSDNLEGLVRIRDARRPFTVYYDARRPPLTNCVFTNLNFERTTDTGTSYNVTLGFQQIQLSERARLITQPEAQPPVQDQVEGETNSSSNSTEEATVAEVREALSIGAVDSVINFFTGDGTDGN